MPVTAALWSERQLANSIALLPCLFSPPERSAGRTRTEGPLLVPAASHLDQLEITKTD